MTTTNDHPASLQDWTLRQLLDATASKSPTPGGGSIVPIIGALSAALAGMVAAYSVGRKATPPETEPTLAALLQSLRAAANNLATLADADAQAYARMNALQKLDADNQDRIDHLPKALHAATDVQAEVAEACLHVLEACAQLAPIGNKWLLSDLLIAAALTAATASACLHTVEANQPELNRLNLTSDARSRVQAASSKCQALSASILAACAARR